MKKNFDLSLYLVTDSKLAGKRNLLTIVEEAIKGGATIVQLREKEKPKPEILELAKKLHILTRRYNIPLIINDYPDIAVQIGAEGVHVGQKDHNPKAVRDKIGKDKILGVSAKTISQARQAQKDGADYMGVGPVFATKTKKDVGNAIGLERIREISRAVQIPIVGIGGINAKNANEVIAAGADGVAVVSAIIGANNPYLAARQLNNVILARPESDSGVAKLPRLT